MIGILQPHIPHYRKEFFLSLQETREIDLFILCNKKQQAKLGFKNADLNTIHISNISIGQFLIYNFFPLLKKKYQILILMGSVKHISTWLVLILNIILKKKIILWGHGISNKRYLREEVKQPLIRILLYRMADSAWFYTKEELKIWEREIPTLRGVSLNNTISGVDNILKRDIPNKKEKNRLRVKYQIKTEINLIICIRFNNPYRKTELLLDLLNKMDQNKYGLIVIGEGKYKPDLSNYNNVLDKGAVYDESIKQELFTLADLYIQPAWIGLSGIEAMAYGLPVCTLSRTKTTFHSVEYNYLENKKNAIIKDTINELIEEIISLDINQLDLLRKSTKKFSRENLSLGRMVSSANESLNDLK